MNLLMSDIAYAQAAVPKGPSLFESMIMPMAMIFVLMYFFMIRPQAKKQKAHDELLANLKNGDEIVSTGGIIGRIKTVADTFVTIETSPNVALKILKANIAGTTAKSTPVEKPKK